MKIKPDNENNQLRRATEDMVLKREPVTIALLK